jgi:tRNA (guanine37-N1)-methyltransferase
MKVSMNILYQEPSCLTSDKLAELTVEAREFMVAEGVQLTKHPIALDYDYWPAGQRCALSASILKLKLVIDEIIHAILPEELVEGAPAGFAATGHVGMCPHAYSIRVPH